MKEKKTYNKQVQDFFEDQQSDKSNTLVFGGLLLAISSIGLLIFVISEKVFT